MSTTTNSRLLRFLELSDFALQVAISVFTYLISIEFLANHGYTLYPFIAISLAYLVIPYLVYNSPFWLRNQKKNKERDKAFLDAILAQRDRANLHRLDIHAKSLACRRWKRKAKTLHREVRKLREEILRATRKTSKLDGLDTGRVPF